MEARHFENAGLLCPSNDRSTREFHHETMFPMPLRSVVAISRVTFAVSVRKRVPSATSLRLFAAGTDYCDCHSGQHRRYGCSPNDVHGSGKHGF